MDDKRPDQGVQDEGPVGEFRGVAPPGQHSPERTVAGAPSTPHDQADDAGLAAAGPPPTGDERVDSALAGLNRLPGRPPEEHVAVLEEVHGRLRDILGEIGETPETPEGHEPR